ncbi:MAG: hypothetical protein SH819_13770 [Cytophagales bacterium]|nr:hypothetical protein [Cytophagales bacterium]
MIDRILRQDIFKTNPPILVDVGASGGIHQRWKKIAPYAICVAFDADDREMQLTESSSSGFRRLITINRIVTDREDEEVDFYLTQSPFCSSALEPDMAALSRWPFQELFRVERKVRLKAAKLMNALGEAGIERIDWLKVDTQGTDLRIFRSLPESVRHEILLAEFEPGILDAYKGEDKLSELIGFMSKSYFMSRMDLKGVARISQTLMSGWPATKRRALRSAHRTSPGWAEVCFMNLLERNHDRRSYLLLCAFALAEKQYGFVAEIAERGRQATNDPFFEEVKVDALKQISGIQYKWPFFALRNRLNRAFLAVFD